jgi:hypothetical protein
VYWVDQMTSRRRTVLFLTCAAAWRPLWATDTPVLQVSIVIRGGKVVSGPGVIRVTRGQRVSLTVETDKADELHLHGYDLHLALLPNRAVSLSFTATRTGRFGFELHKAGTELGVFEIYPR